MDHRYIEEHNLVDRYLFRRLWVEERTRFEDHFVDCPRCLDELELARDFRASLRAGVVEQVTRRSFQAGILAWLTRRTGRALLLGALLGIIVVPVIRLVVGSDGGPAGGLRPQVNIPTYALGNLRSGDESILTSPVTEWLSLVVEVDAEMAFVGYRLTVRDSSGEVVLQESGVEPDRRDSVAVTFPPGSLSPGEYRLDLSGLGSAGEAELLETHAFRLIE